MPVSRIARDPRQQDSLFDAVSTRPLDRGGWVVFEPKHAKHFAQLGIATPAAILSLPGEVVSGHPDRNVSIVKVPGIEQVYYLKRQHLVSWRERLRNWRAGFGWVSRCHREAKLLEHLRTRGLGLNCPNLVAYGEDSLGRAFILVEELSAALELRSILSGNRLNRSERLEIARKLGVAIAELHQIGIHAPDLTAKHIFVDPLTFSIAFIDWQSATVNQTMTKWKCLRQLAVLHASLADHLATRHERGQFLRAYLREQTFGRFSTCVRKIEKWSKRAHSRRSVRDQRQAVTVGKVGQRLIWVAGEAVCAVPEVADSWPKPAIHEPFYLREGKTFSDELTHQLPDRRQAHLIRGSTFAPLGRLLAWARNRPWRSRGAILGRILFHLERHGIPAPQLLAFGQMKISPTRASWFALHEYPFGIDLIDWIKQQVSNLPQREILDQVGMLLRQLHDSSCSIANGSPFRVAVTPTGRVSIGSIREIAIRRGVSPRRRNRDLRTLIELLPIGRTDRFRIIRGYFGSRWSEVSSTRSFARKLMYRSNSCK